MVIRHYHVNVRQTVICHLYYDCLKQYPYIVLIHEAKDRSELQLIKAINNDKVTKPNKQNSITTAPFFYIFEA